MFQKLFLRQARPPQERARAERGGGTKTGGTKGAEPARTAKERVTFQLSVGLIEKVRDAVFFSPAFLCGPIAASKTD
jgi:hypothetical protein